MNFFIYLISEGISKVIPFVTVLVVAKIVDVKSFGELTLYYIVYEILMILISNNITATTRIDYFKLSREEYIQSKTYHLIVSLFVFVFILFVALFLKISFLYVLILAVSALLRTVSSYVLSELQCSENAKLYAVSNIIYIISMNTILLVLIFYFKDIHVWFYSILFGSFIQFLYSVLHIKANSLFAKKYFFTFKVENLIIEFKKGVIFLPQAIGFWVKLGSDRLVLSYVTTLTIVGYYMFAFQLLLPIIILSNVTNLYLTPKINYYLKDKNIYLIQKKLFLFLVGLFLFSILNYFISYFVIKLFFIEKYTNSLNILPYILISDFFYAGTLIYMNVFYYINQKKFVSILVFFIALMQLIISAYFGYNFKLNGVLYSVIVVNVVFFLVTVYKLNKELKGLEV